MARDKKPAQPRRAKGVKAMGERAAGSGGPDANVPENDEVTREDVRHARPSRASVASEEPEHTPSPTAVAAEALRTGVLSGAVSSRPEEEEIPGESEKIRVGDPENGTLRNEYVGEETPGGSTPTPDQGNVDDIGRAYGVAEEDSGELRTSGELMDGRDKRRRGLEARRRS